MASSSDSKKVAIAKAPTMSVREMTKPYLTNSADAGGDFGPIYHGETDANHLCFKVDWSLPNDFTSEEWNARCEYLVCMWYATVSFDVGSNPPWVVCPLSYSSTKGHGYVDYKHEFNMKYSHNTDFFVLNLADFSPNQLSNVGAKFPNLTPKNTKAFVTIKQLTCKVFALNSLDWDFSRAQFKNRPKSYKTDIDYLEKFAHVTTTVSFAQVKAPTLDPIELGEFNDTLTTTMYKQTLDSTHLATRMQYEILRQDNFTGNYNVSTSIYSSSLISNDSQAISYDVSEANSLEIGQWILYTIRAMSWSPNCVNVTESKRTYRFAYPAGASISSVEPSSTATSTSSSGGSAVYVPGNAKIYVKIKFGSKSVRPVDTVTLQRLANTTANTSKLANLDANWTDVISDDGTCTGLVDVDIAGATPDPGKFTWYRCKTVHGSYDTYTAPYYAKFLYQSPPTAADDTVKIVDVFPSTDAKHLIVYLTWPPDDSTGNEIQWTDDNRKWTSTERDNVSSWRGQWTESASTVTKLRSKYNIGGTVLIPSGNKVMSLNISSVEPGTGYYIRARRYLENSDGTVTYGKWNYFRNSAGSLMKICCTKKPTSLKLNGPTYIVKGDPLPLTWTADIDSTIKYWQIVFIKSVTSGGTQVDKEYVLAEGKSNLTYTTIDGAALAKRIGKDSTIYIGCRVHTGGSLSNLAKKTVKVVNRPTLTISGTFKTKNDGNNVNYLKQGPLVIHAKTNDTSATIIVKITAKGITTELPTGTYVQDSGEVIWSGTGKASVANQNCDITLPTSVRFIDNGQYTVDVVAVNKTTGLSSPTRSIDFTVDWTYKVMAPPKTITIASSSASPNSYGVLFSRIIFPTLENDRPATDRFDIYRVTPDGVTLYAAGVTGKSDIYDYWAPYCNTGYTTSLNYKDRVKDPDKATARLLYRIAARSADGAVRWIDVPYTIKAPYVRIDWRDPGSKYNIQTNTFITFPYNLVMTDTYSKDFELRNHLDGSQTGYWNPGVKRTRSITTKVIRLENADQIAKIREMAQHTGPMFVRMPDGCAFEADVQVNSMENEFNNPVMSVSLNITQIDLTKDFGHPAYWKRKV